MLPPTVSAIADSTRFAYLLFTTAERAWAHAMYMKSAQAADNKAITGAARSHIISRLHKAYKTTQGLLEVLSQQSVSTASDVDILETRAYLASLGGAEQFEKQSWEACVKLYSTAWIIYTALAASSKSDTYKELLTSTIEPSIKYGAYQMKLSRSLSIPVIAKKFFPTDDIELVVAIEKLDAPALKDAAKAKEENVEAETGARTITWRSRTVDLEDAAIAVTLSNVAAAAKQLETTLSANESAHPRERASAYDDILIASQDAIDATKHAIDELIAERVSQGDKRVQNLQITRTAIGYDLISWRIGRNRVLCGSHDGALPEASPIARSRGKTVLASEKEEGTGRKLAKLRERVVLYDSTLQSIDSIKELPGVASDEQFLEELEAKYNYFRALKCLAIARSHSILGSHTEALSLLARALSVLNTSVPRLNALVAPSAPPTLAISSSAAEYLHHNLTTELQRHRALVEISLISSSMSSKLPQKHSAPLVESLDRYPSGGEVNLANLVQYPPRIEPVPVKPLFFDVAWNYIEYPGRVKMQPPAVQQVQQVEEERPTSSSGKKSWFGFGRS